MNAGRRERGSLLRGRVATSLLFLLFGTAQGVWTSRIPSVKSRLELSDASLSLALLAFSVGSIVGMLVLGRLVDSWGSSRVAIPAALLEGLLLIPTGYMPSLASLVLALILFGAVHGTLDIAMNANAVQVQRAWGRPVMTSFHAVYSIGGFLGAAAGGLFARRHITPGATFVAVGCGVLVLAVWAALWVLPDAAAPRRSGATTAGAPARGSVVSFDLLLLGGLAMCALVGEGTASDWSAVYLHDSLGSSEAFATSAFAAFSVMMTVGRLFGDRLVTRFGPVRLVRASGMLASVGMVAALLIGEPIAGIVGFACLGAGMSCIAPQFYLAAGQRDPARAGAALSLVVSLGYTGFLIGPVMVGGVSTVTGLPTALGLPVLFVLFVVLGASVLLPRTHGRGANPSPDAVDDQGTA